MPKGKRIAPELQSELVEYSSLLRALKTRNTLDVTTQLQKYYEDNPHDSSDDDRAASDSPSLSSSPVAGPSSSSGSKRKASNSPSHSPSPQKKARRSRKIGWTRWPLELEDVENPQWTLEDEIAAMIPQHIERTYDDDGNEDEAESANYLPHLVLSTSHFLQTILAVIASYTQPRADSLQNRYNPIDWKFVLNVMATQKNIDPTIIQRAEERLQATYNQPINVTERMQRSVDAHNSLRASFKTLDSSLDGLLSIPNCDPPTITIIRKAQTEGAPVPDVATTTNRPSRRITRSRAKSRKKTR